MSLNETITAALKDAMKARDAERVSTLRMLTSAIKNVQIDAQEELTDDQVQDVIARQAKQLSDAMSQYKDGGRDDLVEQTQKELAILEQYLPEQLDDDALRAVVQETITATEAAGPGDMGKVMGAVMGKVKGQADGTRVRAIVQELLK